MSDISEHWEHFPHEADVVSERAKKRQCDEMGTLGSGNHYLEIQDAAEIRAD